MSAENNNLNFVLVGAKNTGKTVFLSTLFGAVSSITTSNSKTKGYLQEHWESINNGETPSATSSRLILLDLVYKTNTFNVPFRIDDYDGYFAESLAQDNPATREDRDLLKRSIQEAEGLIVFFPYENDLDEKSTNRFRHEIHTFITLVREAFPEKNDLPIPVVLGVSKWDRSKDFRSDDEGAKAEAYIDSVEAFSSAKEMIKNYFSDVLIVPFSSFGNSTDGINPVKGDIVPYNITAPLDYFIKRFVKQFEKRVLLLQKEHDLKTLYRYLCQWHDVIKFYDNGKYKLLFKDVTRQYSNVIISRLQEARSASEQKQVLNEHKGFNHANLDANINHKIESELARTRKKQRKLHFALMCALGLIVSVAGLSIHQYDQYQGEKDSYLKVMSSVNAEPHRRIELADQYIELYDKNKKEVTAIRSKAIEDTQKILETKYLKIQKLELNETNLRLVKELFNEALYYPEIRISSEIENYANDFEMRLHRKQNQTQERLNAINNANRVLIHIDPDLEGQIMSEEVEEAIECIRPYTSEPMVSEIKNKLEQRLYQLNIKNYFSKCLREVNDSYKEKGISTFQDSGHSDQSGEDLALRLNHIINYCWNENFSEEQINNLRDVVQQKYYQKDKYDINSLKTKYDDKFEVNADMVLLNNIEKNKLKIEKLKYRYIRSPELIQKLSEARQRINHAFGVINDGLDVYVIFKSIKKENNPLGFKCGGILSNDDILLKIENNEFHYEKDGGTCQTHQGGVPVMVWLKKTIRLTQRSYKVMAEELDKGTGNETVQGYINITYEDLFKLYNQKTIEKDIQDAKQYKIKFFL